MAIEKVRAFFRAKGLEDRIREFDVSSATVELAAQAVGCEPARIGKTLSFLHEDGALLIVCAGDAKIDNSKFKGQFHHKATMLTPDQVLEFTGEMCIRDSNLTIVGLIGQFGGEECRDGNHLLSCKRLCTPVTNQVERGGGCPLQHQRTRHIPDLSRYRYGTVDRPDAAELQVGQVQLENERTDRPGYVDDVFQVQSHGTPRIMARQIL